MNGLEGENQAKRWDQANRAWRGYRKYIEQKADPFSLSFTDLAHVGNFKGGNAIVSPTDEELAQNLPILEDRMRDFAAFIDGTTRLRDVPGKQLSGLIQKVVRFCDLAEAPLTGLGASYRSTLLHFHFPGIVPILDRRVLMGAEVVRPYEPTQFTPDGQIRNILQYYPDLIERFWNHLRADPSLTVRSLDRLWFVRPPIVTVPRAKERSGKRGV